MILRQGRVVRWLTAVSWRLHTGQEQLMFRVIDLPTEVDLSKG
jgi:hypothetical protein